MISADDNPGAHSDSPNIDGNPMNQPTGTIRKRGVVAVIAEEGKLLLIRRAANVPAPGKWCFPGGAIEPGETPEMALIRELREELGVDIKPTRVLWESVTPWGVFLMWWQASLPSNARLTPNPKEVAEVFWMKPHDLVAARDLLDSNRQFLEKVLSGEITLDLEGC